MKYTYESKYQAHARTRRDTVICGCVTIPDQVYSNQDDYNGEVFPIIHSNGALAMAQLMGEEYGLGTPGTGDPVVCLL